MRIRIIYGGKSLGGIECFSFSGKCVRNDMERVRRPDVLGLTREAIFLGLTVFVYRFSPVDVDSKKRFSQFS